MIAFQMFISGFILPERKRYAMFFTLLLGSYGIVGLLALALLLIIGIIVIIFIVKLIFFILPAGIIALVVWWVTGGNEILAGLAFLIVAIISIIRR